jgi:hypothetical protein
MSKSYRDLINAVTDYNVMTLRELLCLRESNRQRRELATVVKRAPPGVVLCRNRLVDQRYW